MVCRLLYVLFPPSLRCQQVRTWLVGTSQCHNLSAWYHPVDRLHLQDNSHEGQAAQHIWDKVIQSNYKKNNQIDLNEHMVLLYLNAGKPRASILKRWCSAGVLSGLPRIFNSCSPWQGVSAWVSRSSLSSSSPHSSRHRQVSVAQQRCRSFRNVLGKRSATSWPLRSSFTMCSLCRLLAK